MDLRKLAAQVFKMHQKPDEIRQVRTPILMSAINRQHCFFTAHRTEDKTYRISRTELEDNNEVGMQRLYSTPYTLCEVLGLFEDLERMLMVKRQPFNPHHHSSVVARLGPNYHTESDGMLHDAFGFKMRHPNPEQLLQLHEESWHQMNNQVIKASSPRLDP